MSENEEKYSAYVEAFSISSMTWALFAGFTFAAITILLTQYPDPSTTPAQITLFIFAFMLFLFLHNLNGANITVGICVRTAPLLPEQWQSMHACNYEYREKIYRENGYYVIFVHLYKERRKWKSFLVGRIREIEASRHSKVLEMINSLTY